MGALTDANFHAESKRVANMFPKASKAKCKELVPLVEEIECSTPK